MPLRSFLLRPVCSRAGYQAGRLVLGQTGRPAPISFPRWPCLFGVATLRDQASERLAQGRPFCGEPPA
jgi:hypothetical protein